jgi:clathrin heavy chain
VIRHPVEAWEHVPFKDVLAEVANLEILYKAIDFYLEEHPLQLTDLLKSLAARVDHTRVVKQVSDRKQIALVKPYLITVQANNIAAVNDDLNGLFISEEDYDLLRVSIDSIVAVGGPAETRALLELRLTIHELQVTVIVSNYG